MFKLNERIASDTVLIRPLTLCQVLCMNNRIWPWLILVPARPDMTELHHLSAPDRALLMEEARGGIAWSAAFEQALASVSGGADTSGEA